MRRGRQLGQRYASYCLYRGFWQYMELLITNILQSLLLPRGAVLLLVWLGVVLLRFNPLPATVSLWSGLLMGYRFRTPYIEGAMMQQLQLYPPITPSQFDEQVKQANVGAIVLLSSSSYKNAPEYGTDTVVASQFFNSHSAS